MRIRALAVAVAAAGAMGCAVRDRPYRFASPMLGMAQVPPPALHGPATPAPAPSPDPLANRHAAAIRVASAPTIREASAAAAAAIADAPIARAETRAALPAPHRATLPVQISVRTPTDLRALVGQRDQRTSLLTAVGWAYDLGRSPEGFAGTTGHELVAWAEASLRVAEPTDEPRPGDLLVFDAATSDAPADLVAIVLARDDRGVAEMLYLGGGVIRRGFVDAARPHTRRDGAQRVVNTFVRHGKRWPAKGSHYLAGELLAHVIHLR